MKLWNFKLSGKSCHPKTHSATFIQFFKTDFDRLIAFRHNDHANKIDPTVGMDSMSKKLQNILFKQNLAKNPSVLGCRHERYALKGV